MSVELSLIISFVNELDKPREIMGRKLLAPRIAFYFILFYFGLSKWHGLKLYIIRHVENTAGLTIINMVLVLTSAT